MGPMTTLSKKVRVRFAPSPTGYLHVGGARTAYFNYLYAKSLGGDFVLRVEDTDEQRSQEAHLKMQIEDLLWLHLNWDEGPHPTTLADQGPLGPYRQSQRKTIYKKWADQLLQNGKAYYCFMTDAEIEAQRQALQKRKLPPHVDSPYQDWPLEKSLEKISAGDRAVVRFRTKGLKKDYRLPDLVRGDVTFPSDMVGDFVLLRSGGMPVYNFCCVVDDHMMEITHVLRAEEHLSNTLRQMMIYEALGWQLPQFGHLSLILDEEKKKLSKRKGATSCHEFMLEGYLPEALKNFITLLGWSHPEGKEIFSEGEAISKFALDRINAAPAVFDGVKLKWMNAQYLRAMDETQLWLQIEPFLKRENLDFSEYSKDWKIKSLGAFKSSMETLADSVPLYHLLSDKAFFVDKAESAEVLGWEPTRRVITAWLEELKNHKGEFLSEAEFLQIQDAVKNKTEAKGKNLFMPVRVAIIGKPHGTELKILVPLMHLKSLINRASQALAEVGSGV